MIHRARSVLPSGHNKGIGAEKKEELPSVSREDDSANELVVTIKGSQKIRRASWMIHILV